MRGCFSAILILAAGCATQSTTPPPQYHVVSHIAVGGEGGWDDLSVDNSAHRLYVSHSDRVNVIDLVSGKVIGEIGNTQGVHAIALAPSLRRGFVSDGRTSSVTIFDLDSLQTLSEVKSSGERPDAMVFDPSSSLVFAFNAGSNNATAIDAATGVVKGTIDLGGKPEFARSDRHGMVYVNVEDTSEIVAIDSQALAVVRRWSLAPCQEPSGLALDIAHHRLFSACDNQVMAISDTDAGRVITTVSIGEGVDGAAWDPGSGLAFSSNGRSGTLTVVRENSPTEFSVLANVATSPGARTVALDEGTHHLYLPTARFGPAPAPTADRPHPRPSILPGTFEILDVGP
ncbi:MAG: YncE family protein [Acidobacteriota bacterium]